MTSCDTQGADRAYRAGHADVVGVANIYTAVAPYTTLAHL